MPTFTVVNMIPRSLSGETNQAAELIKLLDGSRQFQASAFSLPLQKTSSGEAFSIRSTRKGAGQ